MIYFSYAITLKTENYFLHKEHPYHNHWQLPGFGCLHTLHLHNLLDQRQLLVVQLIVGLKLLLKL